MTLQVWISQKIYLNSRFDIVTYLSTSEAHYQILEQEGAQNSMAKMNMSSLNKSILCAIGLVGASTGIVESGI